MDTTTMTDKWTKMDRICHLFLIFMFGCLSGWLYEEVFYWITEGLLRNRGVLYGPWLPIYGVGTLGIYAMKPLRKNPIILFLVCAAIAGLVEYLIGLMSIHCFGLRLWDYRGEFGNIGGILCLRSIATFSIMGPLLHYVADPLMERATGKMGRKVFHGICLALVCMFSFDCILSIMFRKPITY